MKYTPPMTFKAAKNKVEIAGMKNSTVCLEFSVLSSMDGQQITHQIYLKHFISINFYFFTEIS